MPIFDVEFNDGTVVPVEAPQGTPEADIARLATEQLQRRRAAPTQETPRAPARSSRKDTLAAMEAELAQLHEYNRRKESGFLENILSGFGAGAVGVGELAALGGAALLDEEQELRARDAIKETAEAFRPDSGDPESIAYKLASGLGSIAGFAAPAALAAAAAPASAAAAVGLGTAGALGAGAGAGEARERAREAGLTGEELTAPTLKGFGIGTLEIAPVAKPLAALGRALRIPGLGAVGERLATKIDAESVAGRLGQRVRSAGVTGTAEGAQEASAAILQNLVEQGYNPEKELVDAGVLEEGLIGAGAGAILQGLADFLVRGRGADVTPPPPPAGETEETGAPPPPPPPTTPGVRGEAEKFADEVAGETAGEAPPPPGETAGEPTKPLAPKPEGAEAMRATVRQIIAENPNASISDIQRGLRTGYIPTRKLIDEMIASGEIALVDGVFVLGEGAVPLGAYDETGGEAEAGAVAPEEGVEAAPTPAETGEALPTADRTIDDDLLTELGVGKKSPLRKALKGKLPREISVIQALENRVASSGTKATDKAKIREFIDRVKAEVTGREPTATVPQPVGEPAGAVEGAEPAPSGVSPADGGPEPAVGRDGGDGGVGVGPEGGPAVAQAPEPGAVEGDGVPPAEPVDGAGAQPPALAPEPQAPEGPVAPIPPAPTQELPLGEEAAPAPEAEPETAPEVAPEAEAEDTTEAAPEPFSPAKPPNWLQFNPQQFRRNALDFVYADDKLAVVRYPSYTSPSGYDYLPILRDETQQGGGKFISTPIRELPSSLELQSQLTLEQAEKLTDIQEQADAAERALRGTITDRFPAGYVEFTENFPSFLENVGREWVRMLGIKGPVLFANPDDINDPRAVERLKLYGEYALVRRALGSVAYEPTTAGVSARIPTVIDENGRALHVVWVRPGGRRSELLETFAHELGHVLQNDSWDQAPADVKEAVMKDYERWLKTAGKKQAKQWVRELRAHVTGRNDARRIKNVTETALNRYKEFKEGGGRKAFRDTYWGSFSEYFADQVSKWATSTDKTLKPVSEVDKFFARVAEALRKLYASLAGKDSLPTAAMKKYLDSLESDTAPLALPLPPAETTTQEKVTITDEVQTQAMRRVPAPDATREQVNTEIDFSVPPQALEAIRANNIAAAVRAVASASPSKRAQRIFNRIAQALEGTTVEVVEDLRDEAGNPVAGVFNPATNTIQLDLNRGLNNHTILHEAVHAVVSAGLANTANPIGRRLNNLLDTITPMLDTDYGVSSLDEFVSEALTNPEFQRKLSTLTLDGQPVSAWDKFTHAVTSFVRGLLGLPVKRIGSALDQVDELVRDLIAPAPKTRDAGKLYMASATGKSGEVMNELFQETPKFDPGAVVKFTRLIRSKLPTPVKDIALRLIPLNNLVELAKPYIPDAPKLNNILQRMSGRLSSTNAKLTSTFNLVGKWAKNNPEEYRKLSELIPASTYYEVDPTIADGTKYNTDPTRFEQWSKQREVYESLSPEAQGHYRRLRNLWKEMYAYTQQVFEKRLEAVMRDNPEQAKRLANSVWQQIIDRGGVIDPYFPLMREGKYWLAYNGIDPATGNIDFFITPFATKEERAKAQELLNQALPDQLRNSEVGRQQIEIVKRGAQNKGETITDDEAIRRITNVQLQAKLEDIKATDAPSSSFIGSILQTLRAGKVPEDQVENILNIYIQALPEKSFLHSYTSREGYKGFIGGTSPLTDLGMPSGDILTAMARKARDVNRQLIQLEFGAEINNLQEDMRKYVDQVGRETGDNDTEKLFLGVLDRMANFAKNPRIATWSKVATSLGFGMTLGLNISTAMLNLMQLPMIVAPYLTGEHSMKEVAQALTQAWSILRNSGIPHDVEIVGAEVDAQGRPIPEQLRETGRMATSFSPSIDNYDLTAPGTPQEIKDLDMLIEVAKERGALHRSLTEDVIDLEDPAKIAGSDRAQEFYEKANRVSGFLFHMTEKVNRQITLIAAYNLELNKLRKAGKKVTEKDRRAAADKAIGIMEITNGSASASAAPQLAQNEIGKVVFLFKRFGLSMYSLMYQVLADATANADPQTRKMAKRQLAGIFGGAALFSGAQGMPMFGLLAMLHDLMSDDDEDDFETITRKYLTEAGYGGIANYALGVDVASRIGLSELVFRSNPMAKDQSVFYDLLETLGGPVIGVGMSLERGASLIADGNLWRGTEAIMPAAARNVLKSIRFSTEGARTLRGDPIVDDIGPYGALTQFMGFAPAEYIRQLEQNANLKRIDRVTNEERTKLLRKYYVARREGDSRGVRNTRRAMQEFNRKHPQHRITSDTIERSMKSHLATTQRMHHGVTFSPKNERFLKQEAKEYDDNITLFD